MTLLDDWMPDFDVFARHSADVNASPARTYAAARTLDLGAPPLVRLLMGLRAVPALAAGLITRRPVNRGSDRLHPDMTRAADPVLRLITAIYEAAGDASRWDSTLGIIREHLRSKRRRANARAGDSDLSEIMEPHIRRAARFHRWLIASVHQHVPGEFLDRFDAGLVLLDTRARFLWSNHWAARMIARGDALKVVGGRLQAESKLVQPRLRAALLQAGETLAKGKPVADLCMAIPRAHGGRPYQLLITALGNGDPPASAQHPALAVLLTDPDTVRRPPEPLLRGFFGLTPTEARVAASLTAGHPVATLSTQLGVSEASIRWHLKGIFAKTGVSSQAQVVRLMLTTFFVLGDFPQERGPQGRRRRPPRRRKPAD
jgi:DNA-binding CsgD family transcriptional regulator